VSTYSREFYADRYEKTIYSANTILAILLKRIPPVHSAIDIGCGVGTWLAVLRETGVEHIQGLDGSWVDQDLLVIPRTCFRHADLSRSASELPQRYDLAICLEVAEHLPPERAEELVSFLTRLSDYVLFSAAIPFQGGVGHINEQWPHYWAELFAARSFVVGDFSRRTIWNDDRIPFWYRQNILLFSRQKADDVRLDSSGIDYSSMPLDLVHPDLYLRPKATTPIGVRSSFALFRRSLRSYLAKKVGRADALHAP
jgi:SAM-dependent methyltransferase